MRVTKITLFFSSNSLFNKWKTSLMKKAVQTGLLAACLSVRDLWLLPLRVKDICLHREEEEGGPRTVGKGQESAMGKVCLLCTGCLVAGFVGQSIVALLTLNLGDWREGRGGDNHPPEHYKCVYMCENTHTGQQFLPPNTHPTTPTSLRLCFILTVNTWPKQEPLSICEL